jgi:tetratricopeptide (TPR) repeat protein
LLFQDRSSRAYDAFYKATWNDSWQHNSFLQLARIDISKNNFSEAFVLIEKSLIRNYHSHSARHLKTIALRKLRNYTGAFACIKDSLEIDPFNFGCSFEKYLLLKQTGEYSKAEDQLKNLQLLMRNAANNYLEYAFDYSNAGCFEEAIELLQLYVNGNDEAYPLAYYAMSYFAAKSGDEQSAKIFAEEAYNCKSDYCFPNKLEEIKVLQYAIAVNPSDDKAFYYLGNLWFGFRQYAEAINAFEKSIAINPSFATAHRNLSLLYFNKEQNSDKALRALEFAFSFDKTDARVLMELDQLYKRLNYPIKKRLEILNNNHTLVVQRDDLYLEKISLENSLGNYRTAKKMLEERIFHPWEGGEGKVIRQYLICHLELAKKAIQEKLFDTALCLLEAAEQYPKNLGEGKLLGTQENDIHYLQGCVYEAMGMNEQAIEKFKQATEGISEPVQAIFYNDPQPDKIIYQGLAWLKLGQCKKAEKIFHRLVEFADQHFNDEIRIDYFAVSLPDLLVFDTDLNEKNKNHCRYLKGLGELGLKNYEASTNYLHEVLKYDASHAGAIIHLDMINFLIKQKETDHDKIKVN